MHKDGSRTRSSNSRKSSMKHPHGITSRFPCQFCRQAARVHLPEPEIVICKGDVGFRTDSQWQKGQPTCLWCPSISSLKYYPQSICRCLKLKGS